jgi:hypothetical protein
VGCVSCLNTPYEELDFIEFSFLKASYPNPAPLLFMRGTAVLAIQKPLWLFECPVDMRHSNNHKGLSVIQSDHLLTLNQMAKAEL